MESSAEAVASRKGEAYNLNQGRVPQEMFTSAR